MILCRENNEARIIVVADGISSCKNALQGAQLACKVAANALLGETQFLFSLAPAVIASLILENIKRELRTLSLVTSQSEQSYSSTLSFVCFNKHSEQVMLFVLGNSFIYALSQNGISPVCLPDEAGAKLTPCTTTKGAEQCTKVEILAKGSPAYLIASDGAWRCFYQRGIWDPSFLTAVKKNCLQQFLKNNCCEDDCSIVIMNTKENET